MAQVQDVTQTLSMQLNVEVPFGISMETRIANCAFAVRWSFRNLGSQPSLSFNCAVDLIVAHKRKRVSIDILEPGEYSPPNRLLCGSSSSLCRAWCRQLVLILDSS